MTAQLERRSCPVAWILAALPLLTSMQQTCHKRGVTGGMSHAHSTHAVTLTCLMCGSVAMNEYMTGLIEGLMTAVA